MNGTRDPESSTEAAVSSKRSVPRIVPSTFLPKNKSNINAEWAEKNADTLKELAPELSGDDHQRYGRNMWDIAKQFVSDRYNDHMQDVAVKLDLKTPDGELIKSASDMIDKVVNEAPEFNHRWLERMLTLLKLPHSRKHSGWVNKAQMDLEKKYSIEIKTEGKETTTFVDKIAYQCYLKNGQRFRRVLRYRFKVVFLERDLGKRHEQIPGMVLVRSEPIVVCGITGTVAHYQAITNEARAQAGDLESLITQRLAPDHSSGAVANLQTEFTQALRSSLCSLGHREARSASASDQGLKNGQSSAEDTGSTADKEGGSSPSAGDTSLSSLDGSEDGERARNDDETWWHGKQNPSKPSLRNCVDKESGHYFDCRGTEWPSLEHKANHNRLERNPRVTEGLGLSTAKKILAPKAPRRKQGKKGSAAVATTSARESSARSKVWFILRLIKMCFCMCI